jgi:hypothetical protein
MILETDDDPDEPMATRRLPMVSGLAAVLVCALFLAVVIIPPSPGQGPAPTAAPPVEPQGERSVAPPRTASTLTIVSVPQDGVVTRLCSDLPVYVRVPPPSSDGPLASLAPAVGRAVSVPLTTHIYDRTGELLLYIAADASIDGRVAIGIQRGSTSPYVLCPRALDLLGREGIGHLR